MELTVRPLKKKEAGCGLAAIDRASMQESGLENGDYVEISSEKTNVVGRVWPGYPDDECKRIIRIDRNLRWQADIDILERVKVEQTNVKPARSVTIALPRRYRFRGELKPHIRGILSARGVTEGQIVPTFRAPDGSSKPYNDWIPMKITDTKQSGSVIVTESTEIDISDRQGFSTTSAWAFKISFKCRNCYDEWSERFKKYIRVTEIEKGAQVQSKKYSDRSNEARSTGNTENYSVIGFITCTNCGIQQDITITDREPF